MSNYLVVGAGLAGSTCARLLAEKNHKVTIIDKNNHVAGNCYDYEKDGCYVHKYGPHIFHTNNEKVWNFVNRFSKFSPYVHKVETLVDRKLYQFPLNFNSLTKLFNKPIFSINDLERIISNEIKDCKYDLSKSSFESSAIKSLGVTIYEKFFKKYTEKQWKRKCSEIDSSIFSRVKLRCDFNDTYFLDKYQGMPEKGYTSLVENMLNHENIDIKLNQDFFSLENLDDFDKIIFTGDFANLPYRSTKFKHFVGKPCKYSVRNLPNHKKATRITDFNNLHKINDSSIHNFCLEFPAKDNEFNSLYPINNKQNMEVYDNKKKEFLDKYKNVILVGRLATYKYLNMDEVIFQAMQIIGD